MLGNKVGSLGVPMFHVSIVFYMLWNDIRVNKVDALEVPTFSVPIGVSHTLETISGQQSLFPGSAHVQHFYSALHALKRYQGKQG